MFYEGVLQALFVAVIQRMVMKFESAFKDTRCSSSIFYSGKWFQARKVEVNFL